MTVIRSDAQAVAWLRARVGRSTITAEDGTPIAVDGHCAGIAARAFTGHPAGYGYARDIASACGQKGVIHHDNAPDGCCHLWLGGPGHIATQSRPGKVLCNVGSVIGETSLSTYSGMHYVGWVHAVDVPGWGPFAAQVSNVVPAPVGHITVGGHTPVTAREIAHILGITWDRVVRFNGALLVSRAKPGSVVRIPPGVIPKAIYRGAPSA